MHIGLQINCFTWPKEKVISSTLATISMTAEDAGFYSIFVMDHFFQIYSLGKSNEPMLEAYTTLGFLAGLTKKVKLGTLVTGVIYREPALLIKAVTTLDVLSNCRAYFGIGAAWNVEEAEALGFAFPPVKERFERLEETLQIADQMWSGNEKEFKGTYYHLKKPMNRPQVISRPHPPIMIGGGGEQKTLKLVAKYADACNLFGRLSDDELKKKLDILQKHCKDIGRDYTTIEKTVLSHVDEKMQPEKVIKQCQKYKEMGFTQAIFSIRNVETIKPLEAFGNEIIPEVADL